MAEPNERNKNASKAALLHALKSRAEIGFEKMGLVPDGKDIVSSRLGVGTQAGRRRQLGVVHSLANTKTRCTPAAIAAAPKNSPCARIKPLETLEYV